MNGIQEVSGSIPLISTIKALKTLCFQGFFLARKFKKRQLCIPPAPKSGPYFCVNPMGARRCFWQPAPYPIAGLQKAYGSEKYGTQPYKDNPLKAWRKSPRKTRQKIRNNAIYFFINRPNGRCVSRKPVL